LEAIGVGRIGFLSDQWLLLLSAMAVTVWRGLGYYMIIYLAALANVPRELHEAAMVDGAGAVRRFFTVTVPAVPLHDGAGRCALLGLGVQGVLRGVPDGRPDGGPAGEGHHPRDARPAHRHRPDRAVSAMPPPSRSSSSSSPSC